MNRDKLIRELRAVVGDEYVLVEKEDVIVYEQDGSFMQAMPEIVVLPGSAEEVTAVGRAAKQANVPTVPRGSGTGLAGGAVPAASRCGRCWPFLTEWTRPRRPWWTSPQPGSCRPRWR